MNIKKALIFLLALSSAPLLVISDLICFGLAVWLWPSGFFDIPFGAMTLRIISHFVGSIVFLILGIGCAIFIYSLNDPQIKTTEESGNDVKLDDATSNDNPWMKR